jgi:hypothetical protein
VAKAPVDVATAFEPRFARAQTEAALWKAVSFQPRGKPSRPFQIRIKHLLEFDRGERPARGGTYAFTDYRSEGTGDHAFFSMFDAVLLKLALELLELGFKRKEVVLMLREQRDGLRKPIGRILDLEAAHCARGGNTPMHGNALDTENRVVLVLPRIGEAADYVDPDSEPPVKVCQTMAALLDWIERHMIERLVLVDVGAAAFTLPKFLLQARPSQRVRRPKTD